MKKWLKDMREKAGLKSDRAAQVLTLFFLLVIAMGTVLLHFPAASRNGESCSWLTAIFTATSCACVTGLSTVDTFTQWSFFGQAVLLGLIQIGGLGYMTFVSVFFFALRRRIGLRERLIIQQAMSLGELAGIIRLVRLMVFGTFLVEGIGALILSLRFTGLLPLPEAIWYGVFHSVSAYCNAGFDLFGMISPGSSLMAFVADPVVNLTVMGLVVIGGLGFFVWNDLLMHRQARRLSVHTKLVLVTTAVCLFGGTILIAAVEWNNPLTLGGMSFPEKLLAALFQSCTTRTAGFYTVDQGALTGSGKLISMLLMLVGGSSGSTAGGIKTVTVAILLLASWSVMRNHKEVVVFGRRIGNDQLKSALSIALLVTMIGLSGGILVASTNGVPLGDGLYEAVSAICTVGLSTGITGELNLLSKLILIIYMFFGRVGIMTISFAFMTKTPPDNAIRRPEARVLIG